MSEGHWEDTMEALMQIGIGRAKEVHHIMQTTECHGEVHVFQADSAPGTMCACGRTVWIQKATPPTAKGGPTPVDEPLEK
jgi:hypothetical protein